MMMRETEEKLVEEEKLSKHHFWGCSSLKCKINYKVCSEINQCLF